MPFETTVSRVPFWHCDVGHNAMLLRVFGNTPVLEKGHGDPRPTPGEIDRYRTYHIPDWARSFNVFAGCCIIRLRAQSSFCGGTWPDDTHGQHGYTVMWSTSPRSTFYLGTWDGRVHFSYPGNTASLPRWRLPRQSSFETCLRFILLHKVD